MEVLIYKNFSYAKPVGLQDAARLLVFAATGEILEFATM